MRPTKLNSEMLPIIQEKAANGVPEKWIAAEIGIGISTWKDWKRKAVEANRRKEDGKSLTKNQKLYSEFLAHLQAGYSQRVQKSLRTILDSDNPKDHLAFLERFDPQSFGTTTRIDLDDLYHKIKIEYGSEKAEDVLDLLMEDSSDDG